MNTEQSWTDVAALGDVPIGDVTAVKVSGREIALYEVEGAIYATDNVCTHGHARMSDGFLDGHAIECPLHQGKFDVCTGKALCAPLTEHIRTYPVKIDQLRILLKLN